MLLLLEKLSCLGFDECCLLLGDKREVMEEQLSPDLMSALCFFGDKRDRAHAKRNCPTGF